MISFFNPFASATPSVQIEPKTKEQIDIQVGSSNFIIDAIRNVLSLPTKLMMFNFNFNSGHVSSETIEKVRNYLHENGLHDVAVSVNQYKPQQVWSRIFTNPKTSLLSKLTIGVVDGCLETVLFSKLTGFPGDHYSPSSNTVHLFSDISAMALHECGHAKDFNERKNPILYLSMAQLPVVGPVATLYKEFKASHYAIGDLIRKNEPEEVKSAYKFLIPAFASYCAGVVIPMSSTFQILENWKQCKGSGSCMTQVVGSLKSQTIGICAIILIGHLAGRVLAYCHRSQNDAPDPVRSLTPCPGSS